MVTDAYWTISLTYRAQFHVQVVSCDWQEVTFQMKEEWKSAWTTCGVLCVMIPGEIQMQLWCVNNWDIPLKVIKTAACYNNYIDVLHMERWKWLVHGLKNRCHSPLLLKFPAYLNCCWSERYTMNLTMLVQHWFLFIVKRNLKIYLLTVASALHITQS